VDWYSGFVGGKNRVQGRKSLFEDRADQTRSLNIILLAAGPRLVRFLAPHID